MCQKHYYFPKTRDGVVEKKVVIDYCQEARQRGRVCANPEKYKHAENERPPVSGTFPPSPPLSDSSFPPSSQDTERSRKRRSSTYVKPESILITRKPSHRERRNSNHVTFVVDPPASPRTPPRYQTPVGSPSRSPSYTYESPSSSHSSHSRPGASIEVNNARPRRGSGNFYRHVPNASTPRRASRSQGSYDDEVTYFRQSTREEREADARLREKKSAIERQNEDIAKRPAVPSAPQPTKYRRGSVSVKQPVEALADAMRHVTVQSRKAEQYEQERWRREQRAEEKRLAKEEEEQNRRLKARMNLKEGTTSGHSRQRAPAIVYGDGLYR